MVTRRVALLFLTLAATVQPTAQRAPTSEYEVKAAFLYNFVHFVEWPSHAFAARDAPLAVCILGDDPFGDALDQIIAGELAGGRRLTVQRTRRVADVRACHLLFVSRSESERLGEILDAIQTTTPVLIVSDIRNFVARGGTIGFVLERNRVRFEINVTRAQQRGLKLSSQLLRVGRIVDSDFVGGER